MWFFGNTGLNNLGLSEKTIGQPQEFYIVRVILFNYPGHSQEELSSAFPVDRNDTWRYI
jgi:hypothetical protein